MTQSNNLPNNIDCRSEKGVTIGLIDSIISICRILAKRDWEDNDVKEALTDLRNDTDVLQVVRNVFKSLDELAESLILEIACYYNGTEDKNVRFADVEIYAPDLRPRIAKMLSLSAYKVSAEPIPIPSSIEDEARKYADGNGFKIDPNDEMGESQASHKYIVDAFIAGSQLRPDTSRLRDVLEELVELKIIKDTEGKTEDYERRQPIAWRNAREALNTSGEDKQDRREQYHNAVSLIKGLSDIHQSASTNMRASWIMEHFHITKK